nr:TPA_asm: dUTPase [Bos-associated insect adintovirus 2]
MLRYYKIVSEAYAPIRAYEKSAGLDLRSLYTCTIPAKGKFLINTGLIIQLPENTYGRIAPRSGLASEHFIDVGGKFCTYFSFTYTYIYIVVCNYFSWSNRRKLYW